MPLKSMFKIESKGAIAASAFYLIVGIICFVILATNLSFIHVGIIGILSLLAAYGFVKERVWTLWIVVIIFFVATAFSVSMLYYYFGRAILLDFSMIIYLILTWVFTAYAIAKRRVE